MAKQEKAKRKTEGQRKEEEWADWLGQALLGQGRSYQPRNEGLKATTDNWWRPKVLLKCLVSVEKGGGEV